MSWRPQQWLEVDAGASRAPPAMTSPNQGIADLFVVTNPRGDLFGPRNLAHFRFNGSWSNPNYLTRRLRDTAAAAISRRPDQVDVFVVGADEDDGKVLTWWNTAVGWNGPRLLPGDTGLLSRAAPAVASWQQNRLDVFGVSNPDGVFGPRRLVHWWWEGNNWFGPERFGDRLLDISPAAVAPQEGHLNVFAIGSDEFDGQVVRFWWPDGGRWGGPQPLPGQRTGLVGSGGAAAVTTSPNRIDVIAVTRDGNLVHWRFAGSWRQPSFLNVGRIRLDPAGRPAIARHPRSDTFDAFATLSPDGAFGSRYLVHLKLVGERLEGQEPLIFNWLNAFGPAAIYTSSDTLHVSSSRDDGKISFTFTDPSYRPPDSPAFNVTAPAYGHMRLDWYLSPRVVRTEVWSRSDFLVIPTDHKIIDIRAPQNTFEERGLWAGSARYCYYVRVFDEAGGFGESNIACAQWTPPKIPPPPPTPPPTPPRPELVFAYPPQYSSTSPSFARPGQPITADWATRNDGNQRAPAHSDRLIVYMQQSMGVEKIFYHEELQVPPLEPGHSWQNRATFTPQVEGHYRAIVALDHRHEVSESNESDNENSYGFQVVPEP